MKIDKPAENTTFLSLSPAEKSPLANISQDTAQASSETLSTSASSRRSSSVDSRSSTSTSTSTGRFLKLGHALPGEDMTLGDFAEE